MGCGIVREKKVVHLKKKIILHQAEDEEQEKNRQFSLYTVKEELSDMEQSYAPSKRQSILNQFEPYSGKSWERQNN